MSDLFAPLREPEPVSAPDVAEVRRRGDRLRRRRAGLALAGAVCATAVVVAGASLVLDDPTRSNGHGPVDSPSADEAIPSELDLADGLSRAFTSSDAEAPSLVVCGETLSLGERATASRRVEQANGADFNVRGLSAFPDAGTARAVATALVDALESCPISNMDGWRRKWTTEVRPSALGDQGWVVTRVEGADRRPSGPGGDPPGEAIQIVRVGAVLLVVHQREVHGAALQGLAWGTAQQVESLLHRQLCLLTDQGCAWRSDPDVLRPDGWGPLRLGMSREDLEATGDVRFSSAEQCTGVDLGSGEGVLSNSDELVSITVPRGVTTPDGIGLGSSRGEVFDQYYYGERDGDVMLVRASPTADYEFTFVNDQVDQLTLTKIDESCVG